MKQVKKGFHHVIILFGLHLLGLILPNRGKRLLMLTSLHARLVRDGVFHTETLSKLNDSLFLASTEKALVLPASVYNELWDAEKVKSIMAEINGKYNGDTCLLFDDAKRVSQSFISLTPSWLRYDTHEQMLKDLIQLFYCHPTQLSTGGLMSKDF